MNLKRYETMNIRLLSYNISSFRKGPSTPHNLSGAGSGIGSSTCSSNLSPGVSSYLRQNLSSTPASKGNVCSNFLKQVSTNKKQLDFQSVSICYLFSGGSSRFDPRTFTRPQQKLSDSSFGSPISGRTPNYSSNASNQLLQLNISDISLVESSSPTSIVDLGK